MKSPRRTSAIGTTWDISKLENLDFDHAEWLRRSTADDWLSHADELAGANHQPPFSAT
jgi:hypothetical protein